MIATERTIWVALVVLALAACGTVNAPTGASTGTNAGVGTDTGTGIGADTGTGTNDLASPESVGAGRAADAATDRAPTEVTLMLDWVPNTNHTGVFVADELGYFAEAGLHVRIIQPGEVMAQAAVAGGAADFGIDFQEQLTMARADGRPLVSVAAVIQHNSSGFAAPAETGATAPRDWAGLRYGSFGSPFEAPTLRVLMECDGGDFDQLEIVNTGFTDPLALLSEGRIDVAWIFYGWQGIQAEQRGLALDLVMMEDWFACIPDYYTPVVITSEETIATRPEVVRSFLTALSRGYTFAIDHPNDAAEILLRAAPELDRDLVVASQEWLSPRYRAEATRWGQQDRAVWSRYAAWMHEHGIIGETIDVDRAFTNAFLP